MDPIARNPNRKERKEAKLIVKKERIAIKKLENKTGRSYTRLPDGKLVYTKGHRAWGIEINDPQTADILAKEKKRVFDKYTLVGGRIQLREYYEPPEDHS